MSSAVVKAYLIPVLLVVLAFFFTFQFVDPPPPKQVTLTTGSSTGAYHQYAMQFKTILQRHGIELILTESQGSVENIQRLDASQAEVGFVQGGTLADGQGQALQTLGNLYYEPLWVFHRVADNFTKLNDLAGKTLDIGANGSGTQQLVRRLLTINGLADKVVTAQNTHQDPRSLLKSGQVDAVFLVAAATSPRIRELLEDNDIELMSFQRAKAYQRRLNFLNDLILPRGVVDLANDVPQQDKVLLAATANLVIHKDLHPAVQDLLLQAAAEIFNKGGWFEEPGEFPNIKFADLPVSPEARRFYKYGPPFLQRFLPFRFASLIDRLKVMILPLVVLMIPLMKIMPPIYTWRMRSKIYRWYQKLEKIDLATANPNTDFKRLREQLDAIDEEVIHVKVPLSFASQLYDLRQHIELVKHRL